MTFFKRIFKLISVLLLFTGFASAQSVKVEASLQDFTIKIGDQTKLFLIVSQPKGERVSFPKFQDTITSKIEIVSANKPDTVVDQQDKNRITITQSIVITGFEAGTQTIPAFDFGTLGGFLKTNPLTIQVQTVKVDTTKAAFDIKQPMAVTYTFIDWLRDNWIWVAVGLVIIALIIYLIYYLRNKPKIQPVIKAKPTIPAHITAINKLNELNAKKLWQLEEFKQYHSELTDIVREYLEQRYSIKTYEKTTDEILSALGDRKINADDLSLLEQVLTLADLAKFAKLTPLPHENEASMDNALNFVLKTKQQDKPLTNTEGGSANEPV